MQIKPVLIRGDEITPEKIKWLWPERVPLGELTMLAGNPGAGKTHLGLFMATQVSKGRKWPDCDFAPQVGAALILTAEDSLKHTLVTKLLAGGAEMKNILFMTAAKIVKREEEGGGETEIDIFSLKGFSELLEMAVKGQAEKGPPVRLIMIDPVAAYMGGKDENRNIEVRTFLAPLVKLATKYELAIVGISHLNKDMSKLAIFRMLGSVGFTAAARAVWLVVEDTEMEGRRLLLPAKINVAEKPDGLAYSLKRKKVETKDGPTIASICAFEPTRVKKTADEVFADYLVPTQTKQESARKWLKEFLRSKPQPVQETIDAAKQKRIAERTLKRAAQDLNVERYAVIVGNKVLWMWRLKGE